jgi:photoactive yellow protein
MTSAATWRVCAVCDRTIQGATGAELVFGLCAGCLPEAYEYPVQALDALTRDELDALPYGFIRLDGANRIVEYNRAESALSRRTREDVLGRDFFREVAPCANVRELAGWLEDRRTRGITDVTRLEFVFSFPFGREVVALALTYDADTRQATLLARSTDRTG